ncbi:MAG: hypothetical protein J6L72_01545, partial [Butyricicoccus sp.]|nr:hypothetical protein [Butyricicoccus sp.]
VQGKEGGLCPYRVRHDDEDRDEAFSDALDEFEDLIEEYETLDVPGIDEIIGRLKMTVSLAKNNL